MQSLQPPDHSNQVSPNIRFSQVAALLLAFVDLLQQITRIGTLLNNTEAPRFVIKERLLVCNYVFMLDGCQEPDLVQSVLLFLVGQ
jgi:hypothetical protein